MLPGRIGAFLARPRLRRRASWSLSLVLIPFALVAQSAGTIAGRVAAANGTPVAGAFILIDAGTRPLAQTVADGRYRIAAVAHGTHTVVVRAWGFAVSTRAVDVGATPATAEFTVSPTAATLSAVTVSV